MTAPLRLKGIAWDHSRAFPPLVATAQRYEETHPGVRIEWRKRTLDEFGHAPIDQLAADFDLIVIDHPWAGYCFQHDLVHDLFPFLSPADRTAMETGTIGESHRSYVWDGKLLALAIDAAAPAPSWRSDLMESLGEPLPCCWDDVVALAGRGHAVIPGFNADLFLHFWMLLNAVSSESPGAGDEPPPRSAQTEAIDLLRQLTSAMPCIIYDLNPIQVAEWMTSTDEVAYNAFAYTYGNYARPGFARRPLSFGNPVPLRRGGPALRSVIGGTGIAISKRCQAPRAALDYALYTASVDIQKRIYFPAGGQPAAAAAWNDPGLDALAGGFFSATCEGQSMAIIRPRYDGYVPIQTKGGLLLQQHLRDGRSLSATLEDLDRLYRASRRPLSSPHP